jgi:hypothetical protein
MEDDPHPARFAPTSPFQGEVKSGGRNSKQKGRGLHRALFY